MRPHLRLLTVIAGLALAWLGAPAAGQEEPDYELLRDRMVSLIEIQVMLSSGNTGIEELDPRISQAMRAVPRHAVVPRVPRQRRRRTARHRSTCRGPSEHRAEHRRILEV